MRRKVLHKHLSIYQTLVLFLISFIWNMLLSHEKPVSFEFDGSNTYKKCQVCVRETAAWYSAYILQMAYFSYVVDEELSLFFFLKRGHSITPLCLLKLNRLLVYAGPISPPRYKLSIYLSIYYTIHRELTEWFKNDENMWSVSLLRFSQSNPIII